MLKNLPKELANYIFYFLRLYEYNEINLYRFPLDYKQYFKNNPKELSYESMKRCYNKKEFIRYYYDVYYDLSNYLMIDVGKYSNLNTVKFIHYELKLPFTYSTSIYACKYGNIEVIKFLHYYTITEIPNNCIHWASRHNHLDIMTFLYYEVQLKPDDVTVKWAIYDGKINILKFLIDVAKVEITNEHLELALSEKQLETYNYLKTYVK